MLPGARLEALGRDLTPEMLGGTVQLFAGMNAGLDPATKVTLINASKGVSMNGTAGSTLQLPADPGNRIVLCKELDVTQGSLVFHTNYRGRKGRASPEWMTVPRLMGTGLLRLCQTRRTNPTRLGQNVRQHCPGGPLKLTQSPRPVGSGAVFPPRSRDDPASDRPERQPLELASRRGRSQGKRDPRQVTRAPAAS